MNFLKIKNKALTFKNPDYAPEKPVPDNFQS